MGNTPSQEAPRASSRKLSKPRVAGASTRPKDCIASSAPGSHVAIHNIKAAQFSNSYLVGTVPIPASQRTSFDIVSPGPTKTVFHDHPLADPASVDRLHSILSDPKSPTHPSRDDFQRTGRTQRRESAGPGSVNGSALPSRSHSRQDRNSVQPVARTPSVQTTKTRIGTRDGPCIDGEPMPRSQSLIERRASYHSRSNSIGGETTDAACNLRTNSTTPQPEFAPPNRTQSETSLYPPHRRRSLVTTPGVATRAEPTKTIRRKASFRRSLEPKPSVSRENSFDSKKSRHMSLPVLPSRSDVGDRAPTPSDAEYKQLGGMAFGSLRIINGAPTPSPSKEPEGGVLYAPKASSAATRERPSATAPATLQIHEVNGPDMTSEKHPHLTIEPASPRSPRSPKTTAPGRESYKQRIEAPRSLLRSQARSTPVTIRPPTPELETTSKHAAVDDQLFEDEEDSPRPGSASPVVQVVQVARELDMGMKSPTRPSLVHVSRKDSGYVSNTSKSSHKTPSIVDSGCSSNASIRSFQRRMNTDGSDYLSSASHSSESSGSSPMCELSSTGTSPLRPDEIPSPEEQPQPSISSSKDDASVSTPRTSTSSTTHSIIRLPSLRAAKSREQQLRKSPSQDRPRSPGKFLQRVASQTKPSSPTGNAHAPQRMSGLRRLLSGGSRKGLATSYAVHEIDATVPAVPTAVEEKLQGHNANFPTAPKRLALRMEASRDSLGTIMSVEDQSDTGTSEQIPAPPSQQQQQQQQHQRKPHPQPQHQREPAESRPNHQRRRSTRLSISSVSGSISDAATSLLSPKSTSAPRNVIRRRATMDEKTHQAARTLRMGDDSDDDVVVDATMVDDRNFLLPSMRRSVGNSAFDQAMAGLGDQGRYPTPERHSWMQEPYNDPRALRRPPQLRNRKSAPDVRQTMAGHLSPVFERDPVMASRTPPPISLQTRGSKKKRGSHKSSRRQSSPAGVPQYRQPMPYDPYDSAPSSAQSSTEELGHYPYPAAAAAPPVPPIPPMPGPYPRAAPLPQSQSASYGSPQWTAPAPKMRRPLFGQRFSYDGHGYRPPQPQQSNLAPMPSRAQSKDHWMPNRHLQESESNDAPERAEQSRPSSSRVSGEGGQPPFRVLHSYNSPAYKGIPIWG